MGLRLGSQVSFLISALLSSCSSSSSSPFTQILQLTRALTGLGPSGLSGYAGSLDPRALRAVLKAGVSHCARTLFLAHPTVAPIPGPERFILREALRVSPLGLRLGSPVCTKFSALASRPGSRSLQAITKAYAFLASLRYANLCLHPSTHTHLKERI